MPFTISAEINEAIRQHALEAFPEESCGFITAEGYVRVENISPTPTENFELSPESFITHENALAFVHSHPERTAFESGRRLGFYPFCPSGADMQSQIITGMVFGIVVTDGVSCHEPFFWGDFLLDDPIYDRPFRHGVEDCYTILRKWYWQERGVKLPDFARDPEWWNSDANLYLNNFPGAGFRRMGSDEPIQAGDVGLIQIGNRAVRGINHAFIYLGDGTVCQHLPNRLSSREAMGGRLREHRLWVRHVPAAAGSA